MIDEYFNGKEVFACPQCESIMRREAWYQIGQPLYNQITNKCNVIEVYCNHCIDNDLKKFFDSPSIDDVVKS